MKKYDVLVIDYKVGNIESITNALRTLNYHFIVSNKEEEIKKAPAYILPGVGAFHEAIRNLSDLEIVNVLEEEVVIKKKPLLGICLGMQILAKDSEENGFHKGLGWIDGHVQRIQNKGRDGTEVRVPHVGWNEVEITIKEPLFECISCKNPHFYFDHSYHLVCPDEQIVATCNYGEKITSAVRKGNIFGVQFHPEKSQNNGLRIYRSFFNYTKSAKCSNNY